MTRRRLLTLGLTLTLAGWAASRPPEDTPVDRAIQRALTYLEKTQDPDGSWRGMDRKSIGVTGLAVMAFLAAGHTPTEGPYAVNVNAGVRFILRNQRSSGLFSGGDHYDMYHHGIATILLAEVSGMTDAATAEELRPALAKAVDVILRGQCRAGTMNSGGWRYRATGDDADLSVTGWQLLALRAARNVGCDVPPAAIERAVEYLKRCYDARRGAFAYRPNGQITTACCGTGILGLELTGKQYHRAPESLKASATVLRNRLRLEEQHCFYSLYYCAQAMFQLGGDQWENYRGQLHDLLLRSQSPNGSWEGRDGEARSVGPHYSTAMGVLALAVEYRFLPIYQRGEEPGDKDN